MKFLRAVACWGIALPALVLGEVHEDTGASRDDGGSGGVPVEHTSSLGVRYVAIPGTTVLFAMVETTVSDFERFREATKYDWSFKTPFEQAPDHPVVGVNLQDAVAFCNWLTETERASKAITPVQGYRLPTNNEWSAAAGLISARKDDATLDERVQDERVYLWGLQWPPPAGAGNFAEREIKGFNDDYRYTAPVGKSSPTKEGLYDMAGNVWEWTWDKDIRATPVGVLRGGSWAYFRPECLTAAYRYEVPAELRASTIGFRCVFEDKQRTAALLAAASASDDAKRRQRKDEMAGGGVDAKELAAMRERLKGGTVSGALDVSKLTPAKPGESFTNSLGLDFVPLDGAKVLFGRTEVRLGDFAAWVNESGRVWSTKPSFLTGDTHPAVGVSWEDAKAFCEWLTVRDQAAKLIPESAAYRLPSDVEWSLAAGLKDEKGNDPAARSLGDKSLFPWSADSKWPPDTTVANLDSSKIDGYQDGYSYTAPVGSLPANAQRIFDLGGNASEWCEDPWPGMPDERVFRGGSWLSSTKESVLASARQHLAKSSTRSDLGFRCVLDFGNR